MNITSTVVKYWQNNLNCKVWDNVRRFWDTDVYHSIFHFWQTYGFYPFSDSHYSPGGKKHNTVMTTLPHPPFTTD